MRSHVLHLLLGKEYSLRVSLDAQEDDSLSSVLLGAIAFVFGQVKSSESLRRIGTLIKNLGSCD